MDIVDLAFIGQVIIILKQKRKFPPDIQNHPDK